MIPLGTLRLSPKHREKVSAAAELRAAKERSREFARLLQQDYETLKGYLATQRAKSDNRWAWLVSRAAKAKRL